jgi:hypothetical protein
MVLGSGIRDPGSGIRKKPIPEPGSRGQKGTRSRIRIRNTAVAARNQLISHTVQLFNPQVLPSNLNSAKS